MLKDIGNYLKTNNLVPTGTFLFYGAMTDTVTVNGSDVKADNCICLYENKGFKPTTFFTGEGVEYRGLQIICRDASYENVENTINSIYKSLQTTLINGISFVAQQSPFSLGKDEKDRWEFSVNFILIKNM